MQKDPNYVYTPAEAVEYLKEKRGIIYGVASLRNLRRRGRATTGRILKNTSLWTQEELDAIQPSSRTKRQDTQDEDGQGGFSTSVILMSHTLACLEPAC